MEEYRFFSFLDILSRFQQWRKGSGENRGKDGLEFKEDVFVVVGGNLLQIALRFHRIIPLRISIHNQGAYVQRVLWLLRKALRINSESQISLSHAQPPRSAGFYDPRDQESKGLYFYDGSGGYWKDNSHSLFA